MIKKVLKFLRRVYLRVTDPRQIAELDGERVVFNFFEKRGFLARFQNKRILEIGPKHGEDSWLLASLKPKELVLIDLPEKKRLVNKWLPKVKKKCPTTYIQKNILYMSPKEIKKIGQFDLIWCLGVLYHNAEQIRLLRKLFNLCNVGGQVVIESATTRNHDLEDLNVIEIHWPVTYRRVPTVTHLPSRHAIKSWLEMVGLSQVEICDIYSKKISWQRAVLSAKKKKDGVAYLSYGASGLNPKYPAGEAE